MELNLYLEDSFTGEIIDMGNMTTGNINDVKNIIISLFFLTPNYDFNSSNLNKSFKKSLKKLFKCKILKTNICKSDFYKYINAIITYIDNKGIINNIIIAILSKTVDFELILGLEKVNEYVFNHGDTFIEEKFDEAFEPLWRDNKNYYSLKNITVENKEKLCINNLTYKAIVDYQYKNNIIDDNDYNIAQLILETGR